MPNSATTEPSCCALHRHETEPEARRHETEPEARYPAAAAHTVQVHLHKVQGEASNLLRTGMKGEGKGE